MRHRLALLLTVPMLAAGSLVAHQAAFCVAATARCGDALEQTGHSYLGHPQTLLAALLALVVVGLLVEGITHGRGGASRPPAWPFALVAPAGFVMIEYVEATTHHGAAGMLEPVVLAGLLLQVPFAFISWIAARALLRVAPRLVEALIGVRAPRLRRGPAPVLVRCPSVERSPRLRTLATCSAGRAPPSFGASPPALRVRGA